TAIQNRATKSDVAAKIDSSTVAKLLKGKADTASTTWIKAKADSSWVLDKLKGKLDASDDAKFLKVADSVLKVKSLTLASSITDMIDGGPWYGIGRTGLPSLAPNDATSTGLQIQLSGYYGLRLRSAQHFIDLPENAADGPVTIDGRQPLYYGGNLGATAFTDNNPPIGSWYSDPGSASVADAPNGSFNLQVFSTGSAGRGFQIAAPYDGDVVFFRRGETSWKPWKALATQDWVSGNYTKSAELMHQFIPVAGGTITGDLRISGKLVTNPGATPADYVFEPDYKLAPLSDVEAYTKANKHLPEVPSAADMTSKGVDLAAMNMVLLKKIEELTLHAIAQQKELASQKARVEAIESKLLGR
ncbi:MAG: pyocin knob domain-containing protein, partial [Fibrobacterota bacterium]